MLTLRSVSMTSAKTTHPRYMTSSWSKREKTRRKPLSRRNRRSTSWRRRYRFRSYSQGVMRRLFGGTTGVKPRSATRRRVSSSSSARSMTSAGRCDGFFCRCRSFRPSGASCALPGERAKATAVRASAATRGSWVLHPPRDFPMPWAPFFVAPPCHRDAP